MRKKLSLACLLFIGVMGLYAWLRMFAGADGDGRLTAAGFVNLKYFTVLSNLFDAFVSFACAVSLIREWRGGISRRLFLLKFVSTVAVTLTFMVVLCFLGPLYGFGTMYVGSNFWYHLVIPVLSVFNFAFLMDGGEPPFSWTFAATVPMLVYGAAYLGNIIINGRGEWPDTNDWYGFAAWGIPASFLVFAVIAAFTWLFAVAIRAARKVVTKRFR